jgi:hypothetical protein
MIAQIGLTLGPAIFYWLTGSETVTPIFETITPNFPALPASISPLDVVSDLAKGAVITTTSPHQFLPQVIKFTMKWGPRIGLLIWSSKQAWIHNIISTSWKFLRNIFISKSIPNIMFNSASTTPTASQVIVDTGIKNYNKIDKVGKIIKGMWRTIVVVIGTIGTRVVAISRSGTGRVFHQHIGVNDLQKLF